MELVDVFRVETEDQKGPYIEAHVSLSHGFGGTMWERHPAPHNDPIALLGPPTEADVWEKHEWRWYDQNGEHPMLGIAEDEYCGFHSITQLRNWFDIDNNFKALHRRGHGIARYLVPANKVRYGVSQVVFQRNAFNVERISHTSILDALAGG